MVENKKGIKIVDDPSASPLGSFLDEIVEKIRDEIPELTIPGTQIVQDQEVNIEYPDAIPQGDELPDSSVK